MSYHHCLARGRHGLLALAAWVGLTTLAGVASAGMLSLLDLNSQINIDTAAGGISDWSLDTVNYADIQTLSYQVGSSGPLTAWQYSSSSVFSTGDGQINGAAIRYQGDSGLQLTQIYTLVGSQPGSGSSDVSEQFQLTNSGSLPIDLHLFQYNNLQISNGEDSLQFLSPSHVYQTSPTGTAEVVVTGISAYQAGTAPALASALAGGSPLTNNTNSPVTGDTASAMEWDVQLGAGKSYTFSEDNALNVVPEPSTGLLLAALAAGAALAYLGHFSLARN